MQSPTTILGGSESISIDERVVMESEAITAAVKLYAADKDTKLKLYKSKDGRVQFYSDAKSKEAKSIMKLTEAMLGKLDDTIGPVELEEDESGELLGFMIKKGPAYYGLCNAVAEAAPSQRSFMSSSKNTTGFTLFAPELTVYFHDMSVQEEAKIDHSLAHSFIHLELERRYGEVPLWIRESIATALEDMTTGEVWGPWHRNGFVFARSHGDWRGKQTQKQIARLKDLERIFTYKANPYDDFFAHEGFAFAVYALTQEPQALATMLKGMQEMYPETNPKGGRSLMTYEQTQEIFDSSFEPGFLVRLQEWWVKPLRWNEKPKKSKKKKS
ncbi:MAG: hypothetical protein GY747_11040 [Planctomycetes bacterium]|nr:hypothetical protein [Planctomycetota bacterium]MCP4772165.1 hypothetical protein [Planctomycetota bacterium]MCP4861374.1 hypothetical protein [Planctomycetota bacterium]